jgi:hypothetical protein
MNRDRDFGEALDDLRCRTTQWVRAELHRSTRNKRYWEAREMQCAKVLDERATRDATAEDALVANHVSARAAKATVEMARRLEAQPEIAAAVQAGALSTEQLKPLLEIATPETDAEWAQRAPHVNPVDLERMARKQREVTAAEAVARRAARYLWTSWHKDRGMLRVGGEIPDLDGALVQSVFDRMCDRMRPAKGEPWAPRRQRMADALVELCKHHADVDPTGRSRPHVIIQKPVHGPAEANGIPIADTTLDDVLAEARVEEHRIDRTGALVTDSNLEQPSIPADVRRFVLTRDPSCRTPGCERPSDEVHHLTPRCEGGNHDPDDLAGVCKPCHWRYEPNGTDRLIGDPNRIDGLRVVRARDGPRRDAA